MKALVTGASGFLGANVVKELLAAGAGVRALILPGDPAPNLAGLDGVERVTGEVTDSEVVRRALGGCDALFHLAAIYRFWLPDPSLIFRVNIEGTRIVMQEAERAKVARVVHTSSGITCGLPRAGKPSDETTPYETDMVVGSYRATKYESENIALDFARRGLPVVVVNPTVPLGWGDVAPTPTGTLILSYLNGLLKLAPAWNLNVVSVRDVARGHVMAARQGRVGEKYILGGENLPFRGVLGILDELTGFGVPWGMVPPRVLPPFGYVSELVSGWITRSEPLMSRESARIMITGYVFDVSKARRELDVDPLPARVALEEAVEWFMNTRLVRAAQKKRYHAHCDKRRAAGS